MNGPWVWSTSPPGGAAGEQVEEEQRKVEEDGGGRTRFRGLRFSDLVACFRQLLFLMGSPRGHGWIHLGIWVGTRLHPRDRHPRHRSIVIVIIFTLRSPPPLRKLQSPERALEVHQDGHRPAEGDQAACRCSRKRARSRRGSSAALRATFQYSPGEYSLGSKPRRAMILVCLNTLYSNLIGWACSATVRNIRFRLSSTHTA